MPAIQQQDGIVVHPLVLDPTVLLQWLIWMKSLYLNWIYSSGSSFRFEYCTRYFSRSNLSSLVVAMAIGPAELFKASSCVSLILYLKFFISNMRWALAKGKANLRAKEDPNNNANATADDVEKANHAGRIIQNDLENLPMGLVVIWASLLTVNSAYSSVADLEPYCLAHLAFTCMFCCFRVFHTVIYELQLGLPRSIVFMLSMCSLFGLMILMVVAAFNMPETPDTR